jgi:hypothetical protein
MCRDIREDGTIQVSLPPPDLSGGSGFRYYDSDLHEHKKIFVKTEPSRFLCLLPIYREDQVSDIMIRIFTNVKRYS